MDGRAALLAVLLSSLPNALAAQRGAAISPPASQPPVLTALSIRGASDTVWTSDASVTLTHTVVGAHPSEYRASRRADFAGAEWLVYTPSPAVRDWYDPNGEPCDVTKTSRRVILYFQVRATVGEEVRIIDGQRQLAPARVESNVLRASVCAYPPRSPGRAGA